MSFAFQVPNFSAGHSIVELKGGSSTFFVGPNGSGKTRLAAQAEQQWGKKAHRIAAHRSLSLNPTVAKISEKKAKNGLRFGYADAEEGREEVYRYGNRWQSKAETYLLNDFDFLVQTMFAEQSNVALQTHNSAHAGSLNELKLTHFQKLIAIWNRVLPHRTLIVTGDDIMASAEGQPPYSASGMSDGERAVFYMIGQVLVAEENSVLIFDEPELHVHRAILSRLWDEIEAARPDCAFLVITHDLDFVSSRLGEKYIIRAYRRPGAWDIEMVPESTGFNEEIATLILGSRKPVLFVEGTGSSLDVVIYRACYHGWTVIPRGACENVIHAVATMRHNAILTRVTCAGIVDADDYSDEEKRKLSEFGVMALPVSEIENIFLLPEVSKAILEEERFCGEELASKLTSLERDIVAEVQRPGSIEEVVMRYCRRRIDRTLKKIDLKDAATTEELTAFYNEKTSALNIAGIAEDFRGRIKDAVRSGDISALLANFDNKALLALAAKNLKGSSKAAFEGWLVRIMRDPSANKLRDAINSVLPKITAS